MIKHNSQNEFILFTKLHVTSFHFNELHESLLPFHFPPHLDVSSPPFKTPSLLTTKINDLYGYVATASAVSCLPTVTVLFTKQYLPTSVLCFLALKLQS